MFENVKKAIEAIRSGKMVVMIDDEDRENEGDVVFAATFSTPEKVNFLITHAKGVLCTPLTRELAKKFELTPMVSCNTSCHETAFTVSIDGKNTTTGVSAVERDETIRLLVDYNATASDFVRPGHIFPLIAKEGGVLERTGHTEGAVDLCKLAGVAPIAVICEIVKEDGTMARKADLEEFCAKFGLAMVSVRELIEYRLQNEKLIKIVNEEEGQVCGVKCTKFRVLDHLGAEHFVFKFGEFGAQAFVKFHKCGSEIDFITSPKFQNFVEELQVLQNGGLLCCLATSKQDEVEVKSYGIGAQILREFGVKEAKILTKNEKEFVAIAGFGINLV
mgnify:FL=1